MMKEAADWSPFRAYSPSRRKGAAMPWQDMLALGLLAVIGWTVFSRAAKLPEYDWQWGLLAEFILVRAGDGQWAPGLLLKGLFTTLRVGCWSMLCALFIGVALGTAAAGRSLAAALPVHVFVNIVRNTPPLVLLFCVYFFAGNVLPVQQFEDVLRDLPAPVRELFACLFAGQGQLDRMLAAVIALGVYQGAYIAEIVRGSLESVPAAQWEAAAALGFSRQQTLRLVILPQAARLALPPLTGQTISTFKDSALASLISLPDLTFQSLEIMAISRMTFEIWLTTAAIYLLLGAGCAALGSHIEKKSAFPA